ARFLEGRPRTDADGRRVRGAVRRNRAGRLGRPGQRGFVACGALFDGTALAWSPEPAGYGVVEQQNLPVTMSDGTVLRVNVYYPATGGQPAAGPFPVLLTQTPYGKDTVGAANGATNEDTYLIE